MSALDEIFADPSAAWTRRPAASESVVRALRDGCDFALPDEYLALLRYSDGGEGPLGIEPWWFQVWSGEDVLGNNRGYEVDEFLPGYFAIGSSGGGEMFVIRKKDGPPWPVYTVPFVGMDEEDRIQISRDFVTFAIALGRDVEPPDLEK